MVRIRTTRFRKMIAKHDCPVREREGKFTEIINRNPRMPPEVKRYLLGLMKRKPNHSSMAVAVLMTEIPRVVTNGDIRRRKTLDEYLTSNPTTHQLAYESKITAEEIKKQEAELVGEKWFSGKEIGEIMDEIRKRTSISEFGAHMIVHYFVCKKILDRITPDMEK